jgi:hypothetical protein
MQASQLCDTRFENRLGLSADLSVAIGVGVGRSGAFDDGKDDQRC